MTALGASAQTYLTFWPDGEMPLAASLNPAPGEPPTVTVKLSARGTFDVHNFVGLVDVVIDVNGYHTATSVSGFDERLTALEETGLDVSTLQRFEDLEAEVRALRSTNEALLSDLAAVTAKTKSMSIEDAGATVRFTGVNVQVVDGSGDTDGAVNGRGNLVVGYDEDTAGGNDRTGSHNLVVGPHHTYSSFAGAVFGSGNRVSAAYASVTGGTGNAASGPFSSVGAGVFGEAAGAGSSVSGGYQNSSDGKYSAVAGGRLNTADGSTAAVSGGVTNTATGKYATVGGGTMCVMVTDHSWGVGDNDPGAGACPFVNVP